MVSFGRRKKMKEENTSANITTIKPEQIEIWMKICQKLIKSHKGDNVVCDTLIDAADIIHKLLKEKNTLHKELENIQSRMQEYGPSLSADNFVVTLRCRDKDLIGTTTAKILSISRHDDGVVELVIDHWSLH